MLKLFICLLFSLNLHAHDSWPDYLTREVFNQVGLEHYFSDSQFLQLPFRDSSEFVLDNPIQPHEVDKINISCSSNELWPTHPSQSTKEYLWAGFTHYEHHKLPVDSYACLRKNPTNRFCVMAAIPLIVVMSDLFEDNCGALYRGYWMVTYYKSDENMGTLYSRGRTAYPRPGSPYENDMIEGGTYPIDADQFLCLSKIYRGDYEKILQERDRALKNGFIRKAKAFLRIN